MIFEVLLIMSQTTIVKKCPKHLRKQSSQTIFSKSLLSNILRELLKTFILRTIANSEFEKMVFEWILSAMSQATIVNNNLLRTTCWEQLVENNLLRTTCWEQLVESCQQTSSKNLQKQSFSKLLLVMILEDF